MTELHLRDYQREAIDAVFGAWTDGLKRPAIVLPTGAGKTVVFAHLIKQFRAKSQVRPNRSVDLTPPASSSSSTVTSWPIRRSRRSGRWPRT